MRPQSSGREAICLASFLLIPLNLIVILGLAACARSGDQKGAQKTTLALGAYSTPREAFGKSIIPAFQKHWKQQSGHDVEFQESYQGSGAQARAIIGGFEADVAALSLEADIDKIVQAGLITHDWRTVPHKGIVTTSVVVIAVRQGNPKQIKDWSDLAKPGLNILTPDPITSGGAMWNISALYGAALRGYTGVAKNDPTAAENFLKDVFRNVSIMDKGARESITNFERGVGDAAITYENEVLFARKAGQTYDYVVPKSTILIENPAALVDRYVDKHGVRPAAEAFVQFLVSDEAQRGFSEYGFRPIKADLGAASQFPAVQDLWTIAFLGGWKKVSTEIYGPQGVYTRVIEQARGAK